jgi:hypothetical protein
VAFLLGILVCGGFFLPWFKLPTERTKTQLSRSQITREVSAYGAAPWWRQWFLLSGWERAMVVEEPLEGLSGWELHEIFTVEKPRHPVALAVGRLFMGGSRTLDKRHLLFFPVGAAALALIFLLGCRSTKWPLLLPWSLCLGLYVYGRESLQEAYLDRVTSGLACGLGLWFTLYGLLALALLLALRMVWPKT